MKKGRFVLLAVCFLFIAMTGCEKEDAKKDSAIHFGDVFTIKINESVTLTSENEETLIVGLLVWLQTKKWLLLCPK